MRQQPPFGAQPVQPADYMSARAPCPNHTQTAAADIRALLNQLLAPCRSAAAASAPASSWGHLQDTGRVYMWHGVSTHTAAHPVRSREMIYLHIIKTAADACSCCLLHSTKAGICPGNSNPAVWRQKLTLSSLAGLLQLGQRSFLRFER